MPIEYRRAVLKDAATVAQYAAAMAFETERLELDRSKVLRGVEAAILDPSKGFYLLAVADGMVLGQAMVTFEWSDWSNAMRWWLQSVYVHPGHRKKGVFRGIFDQLRSLALSEGTVCCMRLYVERENHGAQATYQKLGFGETHYLLYELDLPPSR